MDVRPQTHILAFDVDDTLADSGQPLSPEMCNVLDYLVNVQGFQIAFVTSRSYSELEDRIPLNLLYQSYAFTCMGMEHWHEGALIYQHTFNWPKGLKAALEAVVTSCHCPHKTGKHLVSRPSKGALSLLGEGHSAEERAEFIAWNKETNFLQSATEYLRTQFPKLHFEAFGKTSIDFSDLEMSKAIVLPELRQFESRNVIFFGDSMQDGGNDRALKDVLEAESDQNKCFWVNNPDETIGILHVLRDLGEI
jgi:HAD superfamily hydrolase (TIGR01484 family)